MTTVKGESHLTTRLVDHINSLPTGYAVKVHGSAYGHAGEPDINACLAGRMVRVEVKMPGHKPTPVQWGKLRRWAKAGALVGYVTSLEELQSLLTHADDRLWTNPQLVTP